MIAGNFFTKEVYKKPKVSCVETRVSSDCDYPNSLDLWLLVGIIGNMTDEWEIWHTKHGYHINAFMNQQLSAEEVKTLRIMLKDDRVRIYLDSRYPGKPKQVLFQSSHNFPKWRMDWGNLTAKPWFPYSHGNRKMIRNHRCLIHE